MRHLKHHCHLPKSVDTSAGHPRDSLLLGLSARHQNVELRDTEIVYCAENQ